MTPTVVETRICLVRHGETDWNVARRIQGHLDIPLNATGEQQAEATARALSAQRFNACYSSDLVRAHRTATHAAASLRLEPRLDARLRERHYGAFQGLTYDEAARNFPVAYARFEARETTADLPGGESLADFAARILVALDTIAHHHRGETVLVVTHGGVLDIAHRLAARTPLEAPRTFTIPNAALNWIAHDGDRWRIVAWARQDHLAGSLDELPRA